MATDMQAVILAGGQGTRLRPYTEALPKPMIHFHGRPFLDYLLEMLAGQGIRRVLLLLGYRAEAIRTYAGDGSRWGLSIAYDICGEDYDTGARLAHAAPKIESEFLLLYCDNYCPLPLAEMADGWRKSDAMGQITVYANRDRHTRDNVALSPDGKVRLYDKQRRSENLAGVDIGFAFFRREVLTRLPDGNPSFEATLYPQLVAEGALNAYVTEHRYYSVGDHARLPVTAQFLARRPTVLLDRDGTLNRKMPRAQYVTGWDEWEWLPGAREALALFTRHDWRIVIITNQPGIARGALRQDALDTIHTRMTEEARTAGGNIDAVLVCPHGWDEGCDCRKPAPGMLFQAQKLFHLDLTRTPFIGDDVRDIQAAEAAHALGHLLEEDQNLEELAAQLVASTKAR